MSNYLELPELNVRLPFRSFINDGLTIVHPHWHKEIEFIFCKQGTVNIGMDKQMYIVEENEIFFFASGEPHYFLASPGSERYVFQIGLNFFDELNLRESDATLTELFEKCENHSRCWPAEVTQKVKSLLLSIYEEDHGQQAGKNYMITAYFHQLATLFYREIPKKITAASSLTGATIKYKETLTHLNHLFAYIEQHYQEPISIQDIADYIGFSPYYFTRFFKTNTGKTFVQFLNEYRIDQAKFILANEKIPMLEVAEKSGFSSVKTFHHVFKSTVGVSPLQYQKKLTEKLLR